MHQSTTVTRLQDRRMVRGPRMVALALVVSFGASCAATNGGDPVLDGGASGGNVGPTGTGGKQTSGGTGGTTTTSSGGAPVAPTGSGGGTGGADVGPNGTGGAGPVGATGGTAGGPGGNGSAGSSGATGGATSGGSGGKGGATPVGPGGVVGTSSGGTIGNGGSGPITPPIPDTASKVPIIRAPSSQYKVEGNYAYGPETAQRLDVIYPITAGPKGTQFLPVVLMFHGGGWVHSYTNNYGSGKDHMTTFSDRFLAHGFMVCDAEYRVADGTSDGALAPAAVKDALLAAKWCWDHLDYFHGDRTRYVVTGASAGGHLALIVGMGTADANLGPTNPGDFKIAAIVDGYGIADITKVLNGLALPWIPTSLPNRDAIVKAVNPMTYLRKDIPPMIVVQGANDNTAPVGDSVRMVMQLTTLGADATMHEVPGAGHGYTAGAQWDDAEKAMFDWLTARQIGK